MSHQGGTGGANNCIENTYKNQVGVVPTDSSSSPTAARGEIINHEIGHNGRAINLDLTLGLSLISENHSGSTSSLNDRDARNMVGGQQEPRDNITTNGTVILPLKRTTTDRQLLEGECSSRGAQVGPSSINVNDNIRIEGAVGNRSERACTFPFAYTRGLQGHLPSNGPLFTQMDRAPFSGPLETTHFSAQQQRRRTQHAPDFRHLFLATPITSYIYTARNPLSTNMRDYSHNGRENVEPFHGQRNIERNTMNGPQLRMGNEENNYISLNLWNEQLDPPFAASSSITTEIQAGGNVEQFVAIGNAEQQLIPGPRVRDVMEDWQQLQRNGQDARIEPGITEEEIMKNIRHENFEVLSEVTLKNKEACAVCQDEYINGEDVGRLDCAHRFHINCIKQWLKQKNVCPLCKRKGLYICG